MFFFVYDNINIKVISSKKLYVMKVMPKKRLFVAYVLVPNGNIHSFLGKI